MLEDVGKGDVVIIAKAGKPMAKLVPYDGEDVTPRRIGFMLDLSEIPEDFDDMMADEIAEMFSSDGP